MGTSGLGPNPYEQDNPNPISPPGVPAATPIPASAITSTPTDSPEGREKLERTRKYFYYSSVGLTLFIPVLVAAPPRKLDFWTYGLGVTWANCVGIILEEKTGQGLMWHIGSRLPSEANRARRAKRREEVNEERRASGLPGLKRGMFEGWWMGREGDDWRERRMAAEEEALKEGGKGYSGLIVDQVKEVLGYRKFEDDKEEGEVYGPKGGEEKEKES